MKFNILKNAILLLLICFIFFACENKEEENGYTIKVDKNFLESHQKAAYFISDDFSNTVIKQGIVQNGKDIRILLKDLGEIPYATYTFSYLIYDNKVEKGKYRMRSYYGVSLEDIKLFYTNPYIAQEPSDKKTQVKLNCTSLGNYSAFGTQERGLGFGRPTSYYLSAKNHRIKEDEEDGIFTLSKTEFPERKEDFAYAIKKVRPNQLTQYNCEDFIVGQKTDYVDFDFTSYPLSNNYSYNSDIYAMTENDLISYGGYFQSATDEEKKPKNLRHKAWYPKDFIKDKYKRFLIALNVRNSSKDDSKSFSMIDHVIQSENIPTTISLSPVKAQSEAYYNAGELDVEQSGKHYLGYVVLKNESQEYEWFAAFANKNTVNIGIPEFNEEIQSYLSIKRFETNLFLYAKSSRYDERYENDYSAYVRATFSTEDIIKNTGTRAYWSIYKSYYDNFGGKAREETPLFDPLREF